MKPILILLKPKIICLAITCISLSLPAAQIPISGSLSFSGTSTIDSSSFVTATAFTSFQDVFVGAPSALSGDYVGTSSAVLTMTHFIWAPPTASTPIKPVWTFVSGGDTYSFDLSVLHEDYASPTGFLLSGLGTAHVTGPGLDNPDTTGNWNFSAQTMGLATFTFSSTTTVPPQSVPDGGTTGFLLGATLLGLGFAARNLGGLSKSR